MNSLMLDEIKLKQKQILKINDDLSESSDTDFNTNSDNKEDIIMENMNINISNENINKKKNETSFIDDSKIQIFEDKNNIKNSYNNNNYNNDKILNLIEKMDNFKSQNFKISIINKNGIIFLCIFMLFLFAINDYIIIHFTNLNWSY